ncbi:MAG: hypothetical protein D6801_00400 [Alphaproteobacteria bacterium]|nr:MAG: hypothetical protein D6801_00400 [Alphaproteobacteria bacterium]
MSAVELVVASLVAAVKQLGDGRILKVLALTLGLMLLVTGPFLVVFVGLAALLEWLLPASLSLPWIGEVGFLGVFTAGLVSKTAWVFWTYVMAPLALAIVGMFLETIVDAVEARHYPGLAPLRRRSFAEQIGEAVRFLGLTLAVSLLALVVSMFSGALAPVVFVAANGYLIAREYFATVALRREAARQAQALARAHLPLIWSLGALLAVAMGLPYLNLLTPIVGVAAFTHLYHRLAARG